MPIKFYRALKIDKYKGQIKNWYDDIKTEKD